MARPIQVDIDVRSQAAIGAFAGIAASVTQAGIALVSAGIEAGIDAIGNSIELASSKAEAASKVNNLFADSANQIHEASQSAAETVGLSSGAYLTAAGNLGNLLTNMGLTTSEAADMSQGWIQLAADVGSFNDADPSEVIEAIGSALRGESEPMARFGVDTRETALQQYALKEGLIQAGETMDKSTRAVAVYGLALESTEAAAGDFAETSDGLANSQRINAAKMEDAWTRVGEKLAPIAAEVLPMLADAIIGVIDWIGQLIDAVQEWAEDNQPLIEQMQELARIIGENLARAFEILVTFIGEAGYRVGGLIGLVIDLAGAFIDAGDAVTRFISGDFEGAAAAGERALSRLQSFQANVQRAMGDEARRAADTASITADRMTDEYLSGMTDIAEGFGLGWDRIEDDAGESGEDIGLAGAGGTQFGIRRGLPGVQDAADDMGQLIPDGLEDGVEDARDLAAQTPGELAQQLRSHRQGWQDALSQLGDDLKNSMSRTKEIARLEGALTGEKLRDGLASKDPIVRAQAQETARLIEQRLEELRSGAYSLGSGFVDRYAAAIRNGRSDVAAAVQYSFGRQLAGQSPPAEGPLRAAILSAPKVADAYLELFNRQLSGGLSLSLAAVQASGPGIGPLGLSPTIVVNTGVGDPVAIGREVSEALRAYQRASGTE